MSKELALQLSEQRQSIEDFLQELKEFEKLNELEYHGK